MGFAFVLLGCFSAVEGAEIVAVQPLTTRAKPNRQGGLNEGSGQPDPSKNRDAPASPSAHPWSNW
ncbi:hypothetical protein X757_28835 [Mesorhizobium sp. LSHC414A00]|nr:hypothetical protein X757_28835 [Mesorhizobium sp. LSHC414A00]